jgi:hypothetical protein
MVQSTMTYTAVSSPARIASVRSIPKGCRASRGAPIDDSAVGLIGRYFVAADTQSQGKLVAVAEDATIQSFESLARARVAMGLDLRRSWHHLFVARLSLCPNLPVIELPEVG